MRPWALAVLAACCGWMMCAISRGEDDRARQGLRTITSGVRAKARVPPCTRGSISLSLSVIHSLRFSQLALEPHSRFVLSLESIEPFVKVFGARWWVLGARCSSSTESGTNGWGPGTRRYFVKEFRRRREQRRWAAIISNMLPPTVVALVGRCTLTLSNPR